MSATLYVLSDSQDLDADQLGSVIDGWLASGGDPAASPFEPSTDVAWFFHELTKEIPGIEASSDAPRGHGTRPIWLTTDDPPPARVAAIHLTSSTAREDLEAILGLAAKYDLVVFDPSGPRLLRPLELMAAYASSTFWPGGAIQAFVAGAAGLAIAYLGWLLGIVIVSWIAMLVGGFMFVMAVITFGYEGWRAVARRSHGPRAGA
jgi:hypothetical protein